MLREQRRLKTRITEHFDQNIGAAVIDFKLEAMAHFSNGILVSLKEPLCISIQFTKAMLMSWPVITGRGKYLNHFHDRQEVQNI